MDPTTFRNSVHALINLLDEYNRLDAKYEYIICNLVGLNAALLNHGDLQPRFMHRILHQMVRGLEDYGAYYVIAQIATGLVSEDTYQWIAQMYYYMMARSPEAAYLLAKSGCFLQLLDVRSSEEVPLPDLCEVFKALRMAFQRLNELPQFTAERAEPGILADLRDSLIREIPWGTVHEMFKSPDPRDTIVAMDLVRVTLPESRDRLVRIEGKEQWLLQRVLLPVLEDGCCNEKVQMLKLISALVAAPGLTRTLLLFEIDIFPFLQENLGLENLEIDRHILELLGELLDNRGVSRNEFARFVTACAEQLRPLVGELIESEDDDISMRARYIMQRIQMNLDLPKSAESH
jgi:hypothetical protein